VEGMTPLQMVSRPLLVHKHQSANGRNPMAGRLVRALLLGIFVLMSGCQSTQSQRTELPELDGSPVVLLPFLNRSETPLAGERAEAIALSVLRGRGLSDLQNYTLTEEQTGLPVIDDKKRLADASATALAQGTRHALTGSVEEWRYKSGLDGEPAVGLSLRLLDLESNEVLWSGSAARSGWSRSSLAGTAQKVLQELADDFLGQ